MKLYLRWLPLLLIAVLVFVVIYFRWYEYLRFSALVEYHAQLQLWTKNHFLLVVSVFTVIYILAVAASIPGATILTITSGFLFGYVLGTVIVVLSATIGATLIFLAVKSALGDWLASRAKGWVARLETGFRQNAFNYLLFLRLVPIVPFWVLNIVPGLLNIRLRAFFLATLLGIIPGSFVYVSVGRGVGKLIAAGETPNLGVIFAPTILLPLIALAVLALVPILYQKWKGRGHD